LGRVAQLRADPPEPTTVDSHVTIVRPIPGTFDPEFFGYMIVSIEEFLKGAGEGCGGQTELGRSTLAEKFLVRYPASIREQQRIVRILDEAFEAIATARAYAERNLQNAGELSESYTDALFRSRGENWATTTLDHLATNLDSERIPVTRSQRTSGPYPYYGASGIVDHVADYIFEGNALLISEDGANLLARSSPVAFSVDGKYWVNNHAHVLKFADFETQRFVEFYLESIRLDQYVTGAAQPKLTQRALNSIPIYIPSTAAARARVVSAIESVSAETRRVKSIYQRKLTALDELKKSLLHRAFTGELTASQPTVIPISQANERRTEKAERGLSTTDRHAGILALAYRAHERAGKLPYFGHVKAEKIAHMVEARLGIDLGREPVKDAAGPNDFPHLHRVEHRARNARFFEFKREGTRYTVSVLPEFDKLIERTREDLGEQCAEVERLIELMLPMDTTRAEILATVYAAWNNLLLDGLSPTDEEIVRAAREDWHADKLKIDRHRFFNAIQWMRDEGLTPSGTGRRVVDRPAKAKPAKKR
jgi:hypothetical protein